MIDRKARDEMVSAIHAYMDERITAFQFDGALAETMSTTDDKTVRRVGNAFWHYYDDIKDHKIVACKQEWDYFNRLLLLLQSDGQIETIVSSRWHFRQAVAAACLGMFAMIVLETGFGDHLLVFAVPFGVVSMIIAWLNSHDEEEHSRADPLAVPFASVSSLLSVRRRVRGFKKRPYPQAIAHRRIRDPFMNKAMKIPWGLMWLMFSPLPLLFQMLPERVSETRINLPEEAGAGSTPQAPKAASR